MQTDKPSEGENRKQSENIEPVRIALFDDLEEALEHYLEFLKGHPRSEERRVGKECRSRRSPYH